MSKYIKNIALLTLFLVMAYPTYDFMRDFTNNRMARVQNTNYNFSRYLRS